MNEPDIAPLARRLAEENNVDWRRLEGSGDGGRIVERDVLTFLAKVMAGEEELDPTPEPVPEGMQAWPDADVAAYRAAAAPPVERSVTSTLDDDLFLFDDAPGAGSAPAARHDGVPPVFDEPAAPDPEAASTPHDDDGLLLVDEPEGDDGLEPASADASDADDVFVFDEPAAQPTRSAPASELPDLFEHESTAPAGSDDALFVDDDAPMPAGEAGAVLDLDDRRAPTDEPRRGGDGVERRRAEDADGEDAAGDAGFGLGYVFGDATAEPEDAPEGATPDATAPSEPDGPPEAPLEGALPEAAAPVEVARHALEDADVALVRHGQVWRRRIDDRAFRGAVSQVADALGAAPSSVVLALLARAVRREWSAADAVDGWWWTEEGPRRGSVDTDGPIADAVVALGGSDEGSGGAAASVVVADLSTIALDEAVLHLDAPVLALGRGTGDGAWLTLSGDDVPASAVAALGRVAQALATPIRLLL